MTVEEQNKLILYFKAFKYFQVPAKIRFFLILES